MKRKLQILVCGVRFGQFYLEALKNSEYYEIAGILSNGSLHSLECSQRYETNLYTNINQLPEEIDIACVVIKTRVLGGKGTELAIQLMKRGIHVILEQPVHYKDLTECYKEARTNQVCFQVGNLYGKLPGVKEYITLSKLILEHQNPIYLNADLATQVSYPFAKILTEIFKNSRNFAIEHFIQTDIPFQTLIIKMNDIPVNIRAQNQVDEKISDSYMHLFHSITLGVDAGSLSLTDTHGAVIWKDRLQIPKLPFIPGDLDKMAPEIMKEAQIKVLGQGKQVSYQEMLTKLWPQAIHEDIKELQEMLMSDHPNAIMAKRGGQELKAAKLWQEMSQALGFPHTCKREMTTPFDFSKIMEKYFAELTMKEKYSLLQLEEIKECVEQLNFVCLMSMLNQFQKAGIFVDITKWHLTEEILSTVPMEQRYSFVLLRWLEVLAQSQYVIKKEACFRLNTTVVKPEELEEDWKKAKKLWNDRLGTKRVSEYFYSNAKELEGLLKGRVKANYLLYPEGKRDIADDLYRHTLIAWYLNQSISGYVIKIVKERKKVRILEVGAGTGATSDVVLQDIIDHGMEERIEEYCFTDLSQYFLTDANDRYEDLVFMKTQILDLDQDLIKQGIIEESQDIILAAGVLNNVKNTEFVLTQLKKALKRDGVLLISEADGESLQMLISQVFMMDLAEDDRRKENATFMTKAMWIANFEKAGLKVLGVMPEENHKLALLGQKLFIVAKERGGGS
jgi:thiazolinyl imide reductase